KFLFWINAALLFGAFSVGVDERTVIGPAFFLTFIALLAGNGVFHLYATARTRRYSPGVITGALLYIPLAAIGYATLVRDDRASLATALTAALIGGSYHLVSVANHRRRAARIT